MIKQVYVLPNVITAFGLACGLFVIFKANMVGPGSSPYELLLTSSVLLLVAALADVLDGAIARVIHGESEFGVMFDSLADTVSFGVAPSVLVLKCLSLENGTGMSFFLTIATMIYSICGILRLVRFNVKVSEIKGDKLALAAHKKSFTGLPIPAAAACVVSLALFMYSPLCQSWITLDLFSKALILGIGVLLIGFFMVSKWKFLSLKSLRMRVTSFYMVFSTVIIAIFVLYGIIHHFALVFFVISWGYFLVGCVLTLVRLITGKRSKSLHAFDPDSE